MIYGYKKSTLLQICEIMSLERKARDMVIVERWSMVGEGYVWRFVLEKGSIGIGCVILSFNWDRQPVPMSATSRIVSNELTIIKP